jgi:hypothetical protein
MSHQLQETAKVEVAVGVGVGVGAGEEVGVII